LGIFEYKDNQFDFAMTPAGRITHTGQQYQYEYDYTDHLGNIRLTFSDLNGDGKVDLVNPLNEILQEQHYYPFGMNLGGLDYVQGVANAYQFSGKEKQTDHGLNWYDYGARMYDAVIGRWGGVDMLADEYPFISPYTYVANNPVMLVDPDGRDIYTIFYDKNGNESDQIPEAVRNMYNNEYGIKVKYDAKTKMLSYDGEIETSNTVSSIGKSAWMKELKEGYESEGSLVFGIDLGYSGGSINFGITDMETRTAYIDLSDFEGQNAKGTWVNEDKNSASPKRSVSMARTVEHEFLGHAIKELKDKTMAGVPNNIDYINEFRSDMNLPLRRPGEHYMPIIRFNGINNKAHAFIPNLSKNVIKRVID
jgi:RHS repeat-associated protein